MTRIRFWLVYLFAALFPILSASATEKTEDANQIQALMGMSLENLMNVEIVTASRYSEQVRDTPATVLVITRRQIEERRYRNLADLLRDLPGVDFFQGTKSTSYHNMSFRGHESNQKFLILQDGVRIDAPDGSKLPVADNFPLYPARQVEVLYGPAAAVYGADAFAGVINIITASGEEMKGAEISSGLGRFNSRYHQARAGGQLGKNWALAVGAHQYDSERADLAAYYPADFPKVDAETFGGEVVIPAAEREDYTGSVRARSLFMRLDYAKYFTLGYRRGEFRSLTSTGDRPDTALFREDAVWATQLETLYARLAYPLADKVRAETRWDYSGFEVDPKSKYFNIYINFRDDGYEYAKSRKHGLSQQLIWQFNEAHTLTGGLSLEDYYSLPETPDLPEPFNRNRPLYQQDLYYEGTDHSLPIRLFDSNYTNTAFYLQWQAEWTPSLRTNLGLRHDENSRYHGTWNPRLGLVYEFSPRTILKLLYGEAYRAPSTNESMSTFGSFTGERNADGEYVSNFFRAPNFDLEPEESRDLELSLSRALSDNLDLSLNAFYTEVDNLIATRTEDEPTQFIPGASLLTTSIKDNLGEEKHYGADFLLNYRKDMGGGWRANLWGSYGFIDGELREDPGEPITDLPYIARHKLKLGATLRHGNYFITPKLYLIGRANTGRNDKANPGARLQAPGYALMDLHLGAREMYRGWSLYLDIYNLFDRRYYNAAGSASTTFVNMPQQPRSWWLTLEYRWH